MRFSHLAFALVIAACATAPSAPSSTQSIAPAWDAPRTEAILSRTQRLHLAPDLSALTPGEQVAVRELMAAGERMHRLYMEQRHPEALAAADYLGKSKKHTSRLRSPR